MGSSQSNPFKQGSAEMEDYNIVGKVPDQCLTYLSHKRLNKSYLLREMTFNELKQFTGNSQKFGNRKNMNLPYVTKLERFEQRIEDHMCSNFYKLYALWEYPHKSLYDLINEHGLQKKPLQASDLYSILSCCIVGLSSLQQKDIKHECLTTKSILIDNQENIKIADPLAVGLQTNIDCVNSNRNIKNIYLSPQQCESVESQKQIINKNPFKNDVFTLGMIILECGLLERQDECYLDDTSKINWHKIQSNLARLGKIYDQELRMYVEMMLKNDIRNRPDWIQLNKYIKKGSMGSKKVENHKPEHYIARSNLRPPTISQKTVIPNQYGPPPVSQIPSTIKYDNLPQQSKIYGNIKLGMPIIPSAGISQNGSIYSYQKDSNLIKFNQNIPLVENTAVQEVPKTNYSSIPPQIYQTNYNIPINYPYHSTVHQGSYQIPNFSSQPFQIPYQSSYTNSYVPSNSYLPFKTQTNPIHEQISKLPTDKLIPNQEFSTTFGTNILNAKKQVISQFIPQGYQATSKVEQYHPINSHFSTVLDPKYQLNHNQSANSPQYINNYIKPAQSINYENPVKAFSPSVEQIKYESKTTFSNHFENKNIKTPDAFEKQNNKDTSSLIYVEEYFKQGSRYEGYKLNNKRHGHGKFYYQDGGSYVGEWKEDKMNGKGVLYYQSNKTAYDGNWVDDQFQGFGKLYNESPVYLQQNFDFNNFDQIDQFWQFYEGNFVGDLKDGKGVLQFSNKQTFIGNFQGDMVEGQGQFHCKDGRIIRGIWHQNQLEEQLS